MTFPLSVPGRHGIRLTALLSKPGRDRRRAPRTVGASLLLRSVALYPCRMDAAWSRRLRWRRRGAWMWPVFIAATVADGVIGTTLPPSGDSEAMSAATVLALFANLIGVVVISWPLSLLLRRFRPDLPRIVARDYAGTTVVVAITAVFVTVGLA